MLLPTTSSKLTVKWQGPYKVTRKVTDVDYEINVGTSRKKLRTYHVNLLKKWKSRDDGIAFFSSESSEDIPYVIPTNQGRSETLEKFKVSNSLKPDHNSDRFKHCAR